MSSSSAGFPRDFFLFHGLSDTECAARLAQAGAPEQFRRGEVIYSTTQFRRAVGVVTSGTVRVFRHGAVLNRLERGGVFGVAALYDEEEEYVTEVRAASACEVQFFSQELLDRWMREDFRLAENYIRFLSDRIRFLNRRIAAFTGGAADERLLAFLRGRADEDGVVTLSMSMTELSRALDIGRSSLYRSLELLEQDGTIRRQGKQIYLL